MDESIFLFLFKFCLVFGLLIGPIFLLIAWNEKSERESCVQHGGSWESLGMRHGMRPIVVGKITMMQPYTYEAFGCVDRTPAAPTPRTER